MDKSSSNILANHDPSLPLKIFHIDEKLSLFLFWYVEEEDYVFRYVSFTSVGFNIEIRGKNLVTEPILSPESITIEDNNIHILRAYGKYTKLTVHNLENVIMKNETIYAI